MKAVPVFNQLLVEASFYTNDGRKACLRKWDPDPNAFWKSCSKYIEPTSLKLTLNLITGDRWESMVSPGFKLSTKIQTFGSNLEI